MLNAAVPEIGLQRAGIYAVVREFEAAGMAQHVRVDLKREPGGDARAGDQLLETGNAEGRTLRD